MAALIVINGAPGVGKTTLMRRLAGELEVPAIGKDDFKEFLFDAIGYSDREWSRVLGRASTEMLYIIVEECLRENKDIIVENAFWPEFAVPAFKKILAEYHPQFLEVYCYTDDETRLQRFRERYETGERHPGHVDNLATLRDTTHGPLEIGPLVRLDTTTYDDKLYEVVYQEALKTIKAGHH